MAEYRVLSMTRQGDTFTVDNQGVGCPSPQEAVEAWKEAGCEQAELSFPGDSEAVDRNQQEIYDMKADLLTTGVANSEFFDMWAALIEVKDGSVAWLCYDIDWDRDEGVDHGPLPIAMVIQATVDDDEDEISEALSNGSGMCHNGFKMQGIG